MPGQRLLGFLTSAADQQLHFRVALEGAEFWPG
jgi:hypothetical protein